MSRRLAIQDSHFFDNPSRSPHPYFGSLSIPFHLNVLVHVRVVAGLQWILVRVIDIVILPSFEKNVNNIDRADIAISRELEVFGRVIQ